jgi:hypothetical protein
VKLPGGAEGWLPLALRSTLGKWPIPHAPSTPRKLWTSRPAAHEPVIVERDGNALAAVIPIDLFEKWSGEHEVVGRSLVDDLLDISASVPDEEWAKLPEDGAEHVDQYLHGKLYDRALSDARRIRSRA